MMAHAFQEQFPQTGCSQNSMQQQLAMRIKQEFHQIGTVDPETSMVRRIVRNKIIEYLKVQVPYWGSEAIEKIARQIDERLLKSAESELHYMDLSTVNTRVDALFRLHPSSQQMSGKRCGISCTPVPTASAQSSELPPMVELPASRVNPCETNLPSRSTVNENLSTSKNGTMLGPNGATRTTITQLLPALSEYTVGHGGQVCFSPNGAAHDGFMRPCVPGDGQQILDLQASVSGNSNSLLACSARNSNAKITFQMDSSFSMVDSMETSTISTKLYSLNQELSSQNGHNYKDIDRSYHTSQAFERSDQSHMTAGSHDYKWEREMLCLYGHALKCPNNRGECGFVKCTNMKKLLLHLSQCKDTCRDECSKVKLLFGHFRSCCLSGCHICSSVREREATEQGSNSTVSKPASPASDDSDYMDRPVKRSKVDNPILDQHKQDESSKLPQPIFEGASPYHEPVICEVKEISASPSSCSSSGENSVEHAKTKKELEVVAEVVPSVKIIAPSGAAAQNENALQNLDGGIEMEIFTGPISAGNDAKHAETKVELDVAAAVAPRVEAIGSSELSPQSDEEVQNPDGDIEMEICARSASCSCSGESNATYAATKVELDVAAAVVPSVEAVGSPEVLVQNDKEAQNEDGDVQMERCTRPSPCRPSGENNARHAATKVELEVATAVVDSGETIGSSEITAQNDKEVQNPDGDVDVENKGYSLPAAVASETGTKVAERKTKGASILYAFSAEELRDHIKSLKSCRSKSLAEESHLLEGSADQNKCSLCGMERLLFEPPPRFCAACLKIISPTGFYYVCVENGIDKLSVCSKCHHSANEMAKLEKKCNLDKARLEKRCNYAETDSEAEWWVQCDKCEAWQHQICALFNCKRTEAKADYTCANCFLRELEVGDPLEPCTVLGAPDLPKTMLSDHIEKWLYRQLNIEREQRASSLGKISEEVPGVEGLNVRVVSSVARVLPVQPRFYEFFKQENYPEQFPYKSKAILLFQTIEGADVCLFAMYVQEYGAECPSPNQRHIYLAYIDSVKYFRPEIKAATGEALRTFVYHQILVGYLDYCKRRGFLSCSIWACPSTKQDDYVLYCHPKTQKMPKGDKLRGWYQSLIKKAIKENIVAERSTLHEFFLQSSDECKVDASLAHLPYCENDFWPGEVERLLEKKDDDTSQKKGTKVERLLRVAKRDDYKGNVKDMLLMHKLRDSMRPMKEDFVMLHLQHICKHCHKPIVYGTSWLCRTCKSFRLCDKCHSAEEDCPQKDRHPASSKVKHSFQKMVEEVILFDTDDGDPIIESKYFDSRTDFLRHCQDNLYQFDTLRRAKHSTMMILHHLHASACSTCHRSIDRSNFWQCPTCLGFDFCDSCYKQGESLHAHTLVQNANKTNCQVQMQRSRVTKAKFLKDALDTLIHASECNCANCTSQLCRRIKMLFHHGARCEIHFKGGCRRCIDMWVLIHLHSRACGRLNCLVPRCRDVKDHKRKLVQLSGCR